jgi:hypothetical protein
MLSLVRIIFSSLFFFLLASCVNPPLNTQLDPSWQMPNMDDYKKAVHKNTVHEKKYDGFYNKFDISITKLNQDIRIKQLKIKANYSQWTKEKADKERQKLIDSMNKETVFFVSSFMPKRELNNLDMKSVGWAATLEVNGQRYPGKFKNYGNKPYKLENIYAHHTLWHKGFLLRFEIPTPESETHPQVITLTSPFGYAIFAYK